MASLKWQLVLPLQSCTFYWESHSAKINWIGRILDFNFIKQRCTPTLFLLIYFVIIALCRFFVGYGLELSRLIPFIFFHIKRKFKCKTERELRESWAPGAFKYHKSIANDLLIFTISICYAVISPMILLFAGLYFALGWLVMRNQVSSRRPL